MIIIQKLLEVYGNTAEKSQIMLSQKLNKLNSNLKFLDNTNNAGIIDTKIAVPLNYLSDFCRTLEILLIDCEISVILTSLSNCVISEGNRVIPFPVTYTKLHVPVVTLSSHDNKIEIRIQTHN